MDINDNHFTNLEAYNAFREQAQGQAAKPPVPHNSERQIAQHRAPRPAPRPEQTVDNVPILNQGRKLLNDKEVVPLDRAANVLLDHHHKDLMHGIANMAIQQKGISNIAYKLRQTASSAGLIKGEDPSKPTWNLEQKVALERWVQGGHGAEQRDKAVGILTKFKQKGKTTLDLKELGLKSLPPVMFDLNVKTLNISKNALSSIPPGIGKMTKLTSLDLSDNLLKELPEEIGGMMQLKSLDLSRNKLSDELPLSFSRLRNLEEINLSYNNFMDMPTGLSRLNKVKDLSVSFNQLLQAPDMLKDMKSLRKLDLSNNQIMQVSAVWGIMLDNLKTLDLSKNEILELPFGDVPKSMKKLNLSDNPIAILPNRFGPILWAEKDMLKTTSRNSGNMRIVATNTNLVAGLVAVGRLELREKNNAYELPVVIRPEPRGGSIDGSQLSDIDLAELGIHEGRIRGQLEGLSGKEPSYRDAEGVIQDPMFEAFNMEKMIQKQQKNIARVEDWIKNTSKEKDDNS